MASVEEFIKRIKAIEGVAACLLTRDDGTMLARTHRFSNEHTTLLILSMQLAGNIRESAGFSYLRFLSFYREGGNHFHVFRFQKFYLGVAQARECDQMKLLNRLEQMLGAIKDK